MKLASRSFLFPFGLRIQSCKGLSSFEANEKERHKYVSSFYNQRAVDAAASKVYFYFFFTLKFVSIQKYTTEFTL